MDKDPIEPLRAICKPNNSSAIESTRLFTLHSTSYPSPLKQCLLIFKPKHNTQPPARQHKETTRLPSPPHLPRPLPSPPLLPKCTPNSPSKCTRNKTAGLPGKQNRSNRFRSRPCNRTNMRVQSVVLLPRSRISILKRWGGWSGTFEDEG